MYYPNSIEEICYEPNHLALVLAEIKINYPKYFGSFIETKAGTVRTAKEFEEIAKKLNATIKVEKKGHNPGDHFTEIIHEANKEFEKDRKKYIEILDIASLKEHARDPKNFKNTTLKNECPIIQHTLQNKKAKELDKYRAEFNKAKGETLLAVTKNLAEFAIKYPQQSYDSAKYEQYNKVEDLELAALDEEKYTAFGVIGGGIKSHFLFKLNPALFPNRSREAVWALWYLTNKKTFDCKEDSEFLMIKIKDNLIQQNFFYPYHLFAFHAYNIYLILKSEAEKYQVKIDRDYRYVIVDSFLSYVAQEHAAAIAELSKKDTEYGYGS